MSKLDIDDPDHNDANCGLGMAGYLTPDEKEIERLNKHIESLTAERDQLKKLHEAAFNGAKKLGYELEKERLNNAIEQDALKQRVEELERDIEALGSTAAGADSMVTELTDKLQAARELAERVNAVEKIGLNDGLTIFGDAVVNDAVLEGCKAKARDFLKMLEEK